MRQARLDRAESGDEGTFGRLSVLNELTGEPVFSCTTLELPWRDNATGISCIPPGVYEFRWRTDSPAHGECYEAVNVPGRTNIQIHSANLAGDEAKGYVKQLDGCIAPGVTVVTFKAGVNPAGYKDQRGVAASKSAVAGLVEALRKEPFILNVLEAV